LKKLLVCIYTDNPEKETENAIRASFTLFWIKFEAEMLFVALLISKNGKTEVYIKWFFIRIESTPQITEKKMTNPQIVTVLFVALFIESVSEKEAAVLLSE
jgi:hypothetical protein